MNNANKAIELKDFTVNTEAYMVQSNLYSDIEVVPVTVTSVGRQYVKVKLDSTILSFKKVEGYGKCLLSRDKGIDILLFCDEQKAMDITEKRNLRRWLFKKLLHEQVHLSLEQLRAIKNIIEKAD